MTQGGLLRGTTLAGPLLPIQCSPYIESPEWMPSWYMTSDKPNNQRVPCDTSLTPANDYLRPTNRYPNTQYQGTPWPTSRALVAPHFQSPSQISQRSPGGTGEVGRSWAWLSWSHCSQAVCPLADWPIESTPSHPLPRLEQHSLGSNTAGSGFGPLSHSGGEPDWEAQSLEY